MSKLKNQNVYHSSLTSVNSRRELLLNPDIEINSTSANVDEKRRNFILSRGQLLNKNDNDKAIETTNSVKLYSPTFSMMNDYCEENNNNLEYRNSMNKYCGSTVYQVDIAENSEHEIALNDEMLENTARLERAEVGFKNNESVDDDNNDVAYEAEATIGTNSTEDASHSLSSTSSSSPSTFSSNVAIITETNQQQLNLKPILKRKDSIETKNQIVQNNSVLPPILKKRDSINDNVVSPLHYTSNTFNSSKPLSILKNRQNKGSYSLDDSIGLDFVLPADDCSSTSLTTTTATHQLKPILKKKSWSTDEKVTTTGIVSTANETVKGILKSSDKSTSSSTISSKNSILDETVSYINSIQLKSPTHINRTALKSILKSSLKNRSTSLSPCTSTDSLVDDIDSTERNTSINLNKSAFLKRTSLDNDRTSIKLFDNSKTNKQSFLPTQQPTITNDDSQFSVINIKPILKRNSLDSHSEVDTSFIRNIQLATTAIPIEQQLDEQRECAPVTTINNKLQYSNMSTSSSSSVNNNNDNNNINNDKIMTNKTTVANDHDDDTINEDSRMSTSSNVTLRPTNNEPALGRARPKSCILSTSNDARELNQSSIKDRLALLKQNGEEAWKSRLQKNDDRNNSSTNAIGNRLSSLLESQSQWRNRVPENDAKQFFVASKLSQLNDNDKVALRETPKRHGLRGSTLSEKKLGAISSKLNSVLLGDKNPYNSIKAKKEQNTQISTDYDSKAFLPSTESPKTAANKNGKQSETIEILKPDDEESFGSFFGIDNSTLEQILNQKSAKQISRLDSIENASTSIKLLENKKIRVQAPKRRAASMKNPMKLLDEVPIVVDSYQSFQSSTNSTEPLISNTKNVLNDSKMAISALAGLASTEDFKSVANKLRNNGCTRNDSWRTFDLKNSLQSKMLILVKGRRKAHIRLIEPNWNFLNQTDSFILVTKERIYAYVGQYSNIIERTKCLEVSELIRKRKDLCYRSSTNEITLIDCHDNSKRFLSLFDRLLPLLKELNYTETDKKLFEAKFSKPISDVDLDEDDELYEELITYSNLVYMVYFDEKTDNVQLKLMESYCGRSPRHNILQQDVALVFDYGSEMYVWLGKCVSNLLRKKAVEAAKCLWLNGYDYTEFEMNPIGEKSPLKCDKRPDWSWFIRVNHNMEPILFKDKFFNWPAFTLIRSEKKPRKENLAPEKRTHKIVKKDLSAELNLFPVDVENDMINKQPKEQELILEFVSLGRGSGDTIKDEDGLPVKVVSLDMQCFYINEAGDRVELNENDRNFLCSGESYYIRWKYRLTRISRNLKTGGESRFSEHHGGRDRLCYFVWQGKNAKNTKRGLTALNAIEKLREEGACQTYIEHGNEDPVFLRIFQGSLLIQMGKRKQIAENKRYRMFLLNDTVPEEEFMVELECIFKNLRSRMSYVFINPDNAKEVFIWNGIKTSECKRKSIRKFVETNILGKKSKEFGFFKNDLNYQIMEIEEGNESKNFMAIFYSSNPASPDSTLRRSSKSNLQRDIYYSLMDDLRSFNFTPRLFHFVTSSEQIFEAIEIVPAYLPPKTSNTVVNYPFTQDDLYCRAKSRPTFFLIDAEYEVFLWESKYPFFIYNNTSSNQKDDEKQNMPRMINIENEIQTECNTTTGFMSQLWLAERKCALETTLAYCHAKNSTEPPKSYVISAGLEPDVFCGLFPTWNYYDNVAKLHIQDGRKPGEQILVQEVLSQIEDVNQSTYSYEELKRRPVPEGINILCLESYLDDEEFEKVFLMNREEFYSLPTWKQKIIKQEKELF